MVERIGITFTQRYSTRKKNMLDHLINLTTNLDLILTCIQLGCVAIWKPKGIQIARKYLENCFINNKEGAGFAYVKQGKIVLQKGFFDFEKFYEAYKGLQKYAALIHFRIATHGKVDEENCHPFLMNDGQYALVHNGILPSSLHSNKKEESDSRQFAELITPLLAMVPWGNKQFGAVVDEAIGYNKVAILRNDGKVWIFNEEKGEWHKGAWYSNRTYAYGAITRVYNKITETTQALWDRLGHGEVYDAATNTWSAGTAGSKKIVYSTLHRANGYYNCYGQFVQTGNYEPQGYYNQAGDWVSTDHFLTEAEEAELEAQEEAEARAEMAAQAASHASDENWEQEPSDEELELLSASTREELEGDLEFMPETEQERYVQRWLRMQAAKSKVQEPKKKEPDLQVSKVVKGAFPDWSKNCNVPTC